jgi:indolepyruvate decarboxylase
MNTEKTTARFLLEALKERGVRHIYGVPGDYVLPFANVLEAFDGIEHIPMADERDAAWAANLVGRGKLSACYATSMVGCLNMLNGVCDGTKNLGASALVIIGGEAALADRGTDYILHHELGAPPAPIQEEVFKILLGGERYAKSITDIVSAQRDIAQLVTLASEEHRPVYIGIPKDVSEMVAAESSPCYQARRDYDSGNFYATGLASIMRDSIEKAEHPVLLVGQFAERFELISSIKTLAWAYGIPVVATSKGFGAYPLDSEFFVGTYAGHASCPSDIQSMVEESDCLIKVGAMYCDMTHGLRPPRLPKETIIIDPVLLRVSHGTKWLALPSQHEFRIFVEDLVRTKLEKEQKFAPAQSFSAWMDSETERYFSETYYESRGIQFSDIAPIVHRTLEHHRGTPVVADIGNAMAIPVVTSGGYYTSPYGAMGITVGAIGVEKSFGKRPLVIVGDGAFSMWSLGSLLMLRKYESKQIIIVLNNEGWGMLRPIAGNVSYLDIPSGNFEKLTEAAGCGLGYRVETAVEFKRALGRSFASDTFSIINVILRKDDVTDTIQRFMCSV